MIEEELNEWLPHIVLQVIGVEPAPLSLIFGEIGMINYFEGDFKFPSLINSDKM